MLRFAILGLGAGAIYALTALGVVLVYRGSGVLNFAHGAIGMLGAFVFYNTRDNGTPTILCWLLALGVGAGIGAVMHLGLMRVLRTASALTRLIATLGVFTIIFAWAHDEYGDTARIVPKLLPVDGVDLFSDISIGEDRLILLGIGVVLTVVLTVVYRATRFGLATSAVAESRRATAAQGISPDVIATANWVLGSMLAVLAAILIVNIAGLQVVGLTLLIVPALAAALVGGFRSFGLTLFGGLLIGVLEAEVSWLQTYLTEQRGEVVTLEGWTQTIPFLVIILVLVVRGRALPLRGDALERPPEVGTGWGPPWFVLTAAATVAVLVAAVLSRDMVEAVTTSASLGLVVLSLVVVTGFAGQLSLAQFALAGMGAWICARLIVDAGLPLELAALAGIVGAIPIGVLVGLPSLRTRGVNLAVATLGLALVIQAQVLANSERTGGLTGLDVGTPELFGIDFDPLHHPERYALLALGCLGLLMTLVANLRRGRAGRRLVAVRTNERAAASLGISVFGAKLYAFGLAAAIAAFGGILIVMRRPTAVFVPVFSVFESLFVVVYAVIGGIGFVYGAIAGAIVAPSGVFVEIISPVLDELQSALDSGAIVQIMLGLLLLVMLCVHPDGAASLATSAHIPFRRVRAWFAPRPHDDLGEIEAVQVRPASLEVASLGVRYGGVIALEGVSFSVPPGEIVGLIGPNGAGKTTFIDAVTGFARASGNVRLDGVDVSRWSARRRARAGIGRSFQGLELFDTMSVRDNLRAASDSRDTRAYLTDLVWPRRTPLGPAACAAIAEFGLADDLDRRPGDLSFGRRRLVAIARAIAAEPSVLLLDEPAAGLDDDETAELGRLLRRLADDWGLAVLLVEHDVSLVLDVCDQVVVLDAGRQLASGPPGQIRRDPAVVQAYLGEPVTEDGVGRAGRPGGVGARPSTEPAPDALLEVHGLSCGYGDLAAVRELDLEVAPGEVVALLGPNGAGKSTTLLTLAGELPPLAGDARVLDVSMRAPLQRRVRKGLGFVPEERAVISSLSTSANLRLSRGDPEAALELFPELRPLLRRRAGLLSGGEQQMLTLGRALAARPRLLLVDELSLGLAPLLVKRLLAAVRAAADEGVGVLLVEQHAAEALSIADRVVVMRRGRVALRGRADELRDHAAEIESAYLTGIASE